MAKLLTCIDCGETHAELPKDRRCRACGAEKIVDLDANDPVVLGAALRARSGGAHLLLRDLRRAGLAVVAAIALAVTVAGLSHESEQPIAFYTADEAPLAGGRVEDWAPILDDYAQRFQKVARDATTCVAGAENPRRLTLTSRITEAGRLAEIRDERCDLTPAERVCIVETLAQSTLPPPPSAAPVDVELSFYVQRAGQLRLSPSWQRRTR